MMIARPACIVIMLCLLSLAALSNTPIAAEGRGISSSTRGSAVASFTPPVRSGQAVAQTDPTLDCNVISFEGLGNDQPVGTVHGRVTATFGSSWLALVDADEGGNGNFANEPSPSTTAYFLDQQDINIGFSPHAQVVEFAYSAAARSLPVHVIAYDADGNLVDDNTGFVVGTSYDGAPCSGDPTGDFCQWGTITLSSTSSNIARIQILGTISNYFGIDDLKVCLGKCTPPAGQEHVETIQPVGAVGCGPEGPKVVRWGSLGEGETLEFDSGEKLEVRCDPVRNHPGYLAFYLWYTNPQGVRRPVGICPFEGGSNLGSFAHSGDNDNSNKADCLVSTNWISRDYSRNDEPNPWTGEAVSPYLDWAESVFDANTGNLTKSDRQYVYLLGPPVGPDEARRGPEGDLFQTVPVRSDMIDPPLGPETDAFFEAVAERLGSLPPLLAPMVMDGSPRCDFNHDGRCDAVDQALLEANLGKCEGQMGFNPTADIDGNGCLTVTDERSLFPTNRPPVANAGSDLTAECGSGHGSAEVDGSHSSDPDGDPLTCRWSSATCAFANSSACITNATCPLGQNTVTLVVNDGHVDSAPAAVYVTVVDTTPPDITAQIVPGVLWPPDHHMVDIHAAVTASDSCGTATITLASVSSNEPDDAPGDGDGHTVYDIQGTSVGTQDFDFRLRAERSGSGHGRTYTVVYSAIDELGNRSEASRSVLVPHDRGSVSDPVNVQIERTLGGTKVRWTGALGVASYDVIRGYLSDIRDVGLFVDLGPVRCLAAHVGTGTVVEDAEALGQDTGFYYLVDYNDGTNAWYGAGSGGKVRVPGVGDCP